MAKTRLSQATYVTYGYAQVEPNHLSAQKTGQIYAQLPAASTINVLENGQFVKYDYASGVVNFTGEGEWMLVLNEVKLYRDYLGYADFAMKKTDYAAAVYSPVGGAATGAQARNYSGIVTPADPYEPDSTATPFGITQYANVPQMMPTGTTMVPRVFKTNVGDIFTTNCLAYGLSGDDPVALGDEFAPDAANYGILTKVDTTAASATSTTSKVLAKSSVDMIWQVAKVYTMPDGQKGVKLMRIA